MAGLCTRQGIGSISSSVKCAQTYRTLAVGSSWAHLYVIDGPSFSAVSVLCVMRCVTFVAASFLLLKTVSVSDSQHFPAFLSSSVKVLVPHTVLFQMPWPFV